MKKIFRVEYIHYDDNESFIFGDYSSAEEKYKEMLNSRLKDREYCGVLWMWEESLNEDSKEFTKTLRGYDRRFSFDDVDYDTLPPGNVSDEMKSENEVLHGYMRDIAKAAGIDEFKAPELYAEIISQKAYADMDIRHLQNQVEHLHNQLREAKGPSVINRDDGAHGVKLYGFTDGKKIAAIRAIRSHVKGVGLKEAKDFVEAAHAKFPSVVNGLTEDTAEKLIEALREPAGVLVVGTHAGVYMDS